MEQRTKEIGVRKVLGASIRNLVSLISIDFIKLILISNVIAIPFSWYIMSKWLDNFAYKVPFLPGGWHELRGDRMVDDGLSVY